MVTLTKPFIFLFEIITREVRFWTAKQPLDLAYAQGRWRNSLKALVLAGALRWTAAQASLPSSLLKSRGFVTRTNSSRGQNGPERHASPHIGQERHASPHISALYVG